MHGSSNTETAASKPKDNSDSAPDGRTKKLLGKLEESVKEGDYYSALQLFRTQHARALKKGNGNVALDLAYRGAKLMLEHGDAHAGADLAKLLVETRKELQQKGTTEDTDDIYSGESGENIPARDRYQNQNQNQNQNQDRDPSGISQLVELSQLFPEDRTEKGEITSSKIMFLRMALDWSKQAAGKNRYPYGDPFLRYMLAESLVEMGSFDEALSHYVHAHRPKEFANFLQLWADQVGAGSYEQGTEERDLLLAQAVLLLLSKENIRDAKILYDEFLAAEAGSGLDTPMVTFLKLLMETLRRDAYPLFQSLRSHYARELQRGDHLRPPLSMHLDKIGQVFYNVAPQTPGLQDMMSNMMKMMGGGNKSGTPG